eukprot:CAMPEP_0198309234 /NCGR_PEP_ID=MMETSP1450-20131203/1672_1 /TAXON_ID=753684 ORGANISM="Madagascaria erythrocladiodes, Strain CCMP3234" /NCGR_SAMPLE_ID=MMETSP1450 /ASSEMBLY_ACC=CAM_ASM_001115 /LENGTH=340 /DNA_ID=CAMNT_0044011981 /DNA_START=57 /DNA_END=1079 /DNA_ORIENTATION=+
MLTFIGTAVAARSGVAGRATSRVAPRMAVSAGRESQRVSAESVAASPALTASKEKFIIPVREPNTQVFFDNSIHPNYTVVLVFAADRHGLCLDVVSTLAALDVRVARFVEAESDALRMLLPRLEGELVSLPELGLSTANLTAFHVVDEDGDKIYDPQTLSQIESSVKAELGENYRRPHMDLTHWRRLVVQQHRRRNATSLTWSTALTDDLTSSDVIEQVGSALADCGLEVVSVSKNKKVDGSGLRRLDAKLFVRAVGTPGQTLEDSEELEDTVKGVLFRAAGCDENASAWYQFRNFGSVAVAEVIMLDQAAKENPDLINWDKYETPNYRGRLADVPYKRV